MLSPVSLFLWGHFGHWLAVLLQLACLPFLTEWVCRPVARLHGLPSEDRTSKSSVGKCSASRFPGALGSPVSWPVVFDGSTDAIAEDIPHPARVIDRPRRWRWPRRTIFGHARLAFSRRGSALVGEVFNRDGLVNIHWLACTSAGGHIAGFCGNRVADEESCRSTVVCL